MGTTIEGVRATMRTTMADGRSSASPERWVLSVVAIAATVCGWLAMAVRDAPKARPEADVASLPPIPSLEPTAEAPPTPLRRPAPIATTRSSR